MHHTENPTPRLFVSEAIQVFENEVTRVLDGYVRVFQKILWRTGTVFALMGSLLLGSGFALTILNSDPNRVSDPGQIFTAFGIVIGFSGLLMMFLPKLLQKYFRK